MNSEHFAYWAQARRDDVEREIARCLESLGLVTSRPSEREKKKGRWPKDYFSQVEAAKTLGVTREHLNRVLRGHRQSASLTRRYEALKQEAK